MRSRSEFDLSRRQWLSATAFALLSACSKVGRGIAVPPSERRDAIVLGLPNARFFLDEPGALSAEQELALVREANSLGVSQGGILPTGHYLALSGGGDNGAFGAGLLVGWTEHGDRPKFKLVTGVSTGALTAPFAFLGPEYDAVLTDVYTNISPSKVFVERFAPFAALWQDAMADTSPLFETIAHYFDEAVLAKIAAEYEKGRLLLIQTANLDAGVPVLWNIGAIAASGHSDALKLIRRLLLASASIPGEFPPVLIDVEANGRSYQEMHVDGGAVSQSFLIPPTLVVRIAQEKTGFRRQRMVAYVIRNSRLTTDWSDVQRATLSIAGKAIMIMINYVGLGDLYRIYLTCMRAGADFNVAYIGDDFQAEHKVLFDQGYMRALYNFAYEKAARGYRWEYAPPGFQAETR
ncbi:patatin-like phospholipase family protein [Beijerinckia indica]|uniref:Patatin n=1 Tax=Beijerinckia indica subsp. indica (strain ATCC 9039 / DSM 1715 / NCIMB 8712) TaxID=395963 RepID=B2IBV0_BEII9|nr:patatin-like phospholipase family protein [Beijerinckia indica]ACB93822.1 Patatin [Beijerinckia indica subsp. indica ATCC 9039]